MLWDEAIRLGSRQEQNHELIASSDQGTVKFARCVMYASMHTSNAPSYRGYRLPVEPRDGGEGNLGLRACLQPHSPDDGTSGTQRTMPAPGTEFQAHRAATDRVGASSLRQPNRCHARYPVRAHRPTARGQAPGQNRATGGEATTKTLPITHQTTCPCSQERSLTRASEKGQVSAIHSSPFYFSCAPGRSRQNDADSAYRARVPPMPRRGSPTASRPANVASAKMPVPKSASGTRRLRNRASVSGRTRCNSTKWECS